MTPAPPGGLGSGLGNRVGKGGLVHSWTWPGWSGAAQDHGHPLIQAEVYNSLPWECREGLKVPGMDGTIYLFFFEIAFTLFFFHFIG